MDLDALKRNKRNMIRSIKSMATENTTGFNMFQAKCSLDIIKSEFYRLKEVIDNIVGLLTNDSEIDSITDELFEIQNLYIQHSAKMQAIIHQSEQAAKTSSVIPNQISIQHRRVQLPQINLPKFNGESSKWLEFKDLFTSLIDKDTTLTNTDKLCYLRACLEGEAADIIQNIECSDNNYIPIWETLNQRYSSKRLIINSHLKILAEQSTIHHESEVRNMLNNTNRALRALTSLGYPNERNALLMTYQLISKLPKRLRREWELSLKDANHVPTYDELEKFLERQLQAIEHFETNYERPNDKSNEKLSDKSNEKSGVKGGASFNTPANASNKSCPYCKKLHTLYFCPSFTSATPEQRYKIVSEAHACTNCLKVGHKGLHCKSSDRCKKCNLKHHTSLHRTTARQSTAVVAIENQKSKDDTVGEIQKLPSNERQVVCESFAGITKVNSNHVLLPTALAKLRCANGTFTTVRLVLDSCSQCEFVSESIAKKHGSNVQSSNLKLTGIGSVHAPTSRAKTTLEIFNNDGSFKLSVTAHILPQIMPNLPSVDQRLFNEIKQKGIQLADPYTTSCNTVDILIGAKYFNHIIKDGFVDGFSNGVTLRNTVFGWVAFGGGKINIDFDEERVCCFTLAKQLQKFWELEEPDTTTSNFTAEEDYCEQVFQKTTKIHNGRFQVRLPFKKYIDNACMPELGSTRNTSIKQLISLEGRFNSNPTFQQKYKNFINEYIELGHMQPSQSDDVTSYFMPHHGVFKRDSEKIRVVFNASQKSDNGTSLNNELCVGPVVQRNIFDILLNFRSYQHALVADIKQMYRQITVHPDDYKYQKILWRNSNSEPFQSYELTTVTYGTACAPFIATRCIKEAGLSSKITYPETSQKIENDFYVDDFVSGANSKEDALKTKEEVTQILKNFGFELRSWKTSLSDVNQISNESWSTNTKTLGTMWMVKEDEFQFEAPHISTKALRNPITKRTVLSEISTIFDPIGFLAPTIIIGKMLMRDLWNLPLEWDTPIPQGEIKKFEAFKEMLQSVIHVKVPRNLRIVGAYRIEVHIFCDASENAYAAVAYLRAFHPNKTYSTILCSKTKLAPTTPLKIPRLELCGAVLATKLSKKLQTVLKLDPDCFIAWCDSTIVLSWLAKPPSTWKEFVKNRVAQIQQTIPSSQWRHVSTKENPADLASRGKTPAQLKETSLWWNGPAWLTNVNEKPQSTWTYDKQCEQEKRKIKVIAAVSLIDAEFNLINRISNFTKLINVTAMCFRFVSKLKAKVEISKTLPTQNTHANSQSTINYTSSNVSVPEFRNAIMFHIKLTQQQEFAKDIERIKRGKSVKQVSSLYSLCPFLDKDAVLRVGGRLENTDWLFERTHPILLPANHRFTSLLIEFYHVIHRHAPAETLHTIIRQKFWIIRCKNRIKKILRNCLQCVKQRARAIHQIMGNLPEARVKYSRPFQQIGIDYAGPILIKSDVRTRAQTDLKGYICIFICLATKAVHIEAAKDLSAEAFIKAFKRFTSRRGTPSQIFSDNGTNFVASNTILMQQLGEMLQSEAFENDIKNYLTPREVNWHFIPPASPHFGGLWEANIKVIKNSIRNVIGEQKLTYEELSTLLAEIEANMNSRPIAAMSDDPDDLNSLTPAHFLIGGPLTVISESQDEDNNLKPSERWKLIQHLQHQISKRWKNEYVAQFQKRTKWATPSENVKVGDLVLVQDNAKFSTQWLLGRILQTFPGKDGHVRVVELKTKYGIFKRPITKVAKLPY